MGTWTDNFVDYVEDLFQESSEKADWSGKNSTRARLKGAEMIAVAIYDWKKENPNEPVRLIGHSHGGNVAIMVANLLAEKEIEVVTLITIATPVREYVLTTDVGEFIHVYNEHDSVQRNGGPFPSIKTKSRTFEEATNVQVILEEKRRKNLYMISNHSIMHSNTEIWNKYIVPKLK